MKKTMIAGLTLMIAGCGGNTTKVQDMASPIDSSITIAQNLESRAVCSETSWEDRTDDMGRELVTFNCRMDKIGDYFTKRIASHEEYAQRGLESAHARYDQGLSYRQRTLDGAQSDLARIQQQLASPEVAFEEFGYRYNDLTSFIESLERQKNREQDRIVEAQKAIAEYEATKPAVFAEAQKEYEAQIAKTEKWHAASADETLTWYIDQKTGTAKYAGSVISVYDKDDELVSEKVSQDRYDYKNRLNLALDNRNSETYSEYYDKNGFWAGAKVQ